MSNLTILALRVVLAIALAGSLFVQAVFVPLIWIDLDDAPVGVRVPFVVIVALGVALARGEAVAPGLVLLICGATVVVAGVALVVLVMRMLLAQAVARDAE